MTGNDKVLDKKDFSLQLNPYKKKEKKTGKEKGKENSAELITISQSRRTKGLEREGSRVPWCTDLNLTLYFHPSTETIITRK